MTVHILTIPPKTTRLFCAFLRAFRWATNVKTNKKRQYLPFYKSIYCLEYKHIYDNCLRHRHLLYAYNIPHTAKCYNTSATWGTIC